MTVIGACWDANGRVWIGADSKSGGSPHPVRKIWAWRGLTLAFAGEGALALRLQHEASSSDPPSSPSGSVTDDLWRLSDHMRSLAETMGVLRDGVQGQRFVDARIIATNGRRVWVLSDGWSVAEHGPEAAIIGGGDRVAVEAAYLAAVASGATPGEMALTIALTSVCRVWDDAGPPVHVVGPDKLEDVDLNGMLDLVAQLVNHDAA